MTIFPWQKSQWSSLQQLFFAERLPHGLFFVGPDGIGKRIFAEEFAQSLLCNSQNNKEKPCGNCKQCQLAIAKSHPDLILLEPEDSGKAIKVDQVRELSEKAFKTSGQGGYKVILIDSADGMNVNAANALLKTLEEPPAKTVLILISSRPAALPATIRSRCQIFKFSAPTREMAQKWLLSKNIPEDKSNVLLNIANNSPLLAEKYFEHNFLEIRAALFDSWCEYGRRRISLTTISTDWNKQEPLFVLNTVSTWIQDLILLKQIGDNAAICNPDYQLTLNKIANLCNIQSLHEFQNKINQCRNFLQTTNLNQQLLFEELLINWKEILGL